MTFLEGTDTKLKLKPLEDFCIRFKAATKKKKKRKKRETEDFI